MPPRIDAPPVPPAVWPSDLPITVDVIASGHVLTVQTALSLSEGCCRLG